MVRVFRFCLGRVWGCMQGCLHWFGLNDRMPVIRALGMQGGFAMRLEGDF